MVEESDKAGLFSGKRSERYILRDNSEELQILQEDFGFEFSPEETPSSVSLRPLQNKIAHILSSPSISGKIDKVTDLIFSRKGGFYRSTDHTYYLRDDSLELRLHEATHAYVTVKNPDTEQMEHMLAQLMTGARTIKPGTNAEVIAEGLEVVCAQAAFEEGLARWISEESLSKRGKSPRQMNLHHLRQQGNGPLATLKGETIEPSPKVLPDLQRSIQTFNETTQIYIQAGINFINSVGTTTEESARIKFDKSDRRLGEFHGGYKAATEVGYIFVNRAVQQLMENGKSRNEALHLLVVNPPQQRKELYDPDEYARSLVNNEK